MVELLTSPQHHFTTSQHHFCTTSLNNIKFIFYFKSSRRSFETSFFFYLCSFGRKKVGGWAWPDMEIKSSPICCKSGPKSSHCSFHIKSDVFQRALKLTNIWATVERKLVAESFQKLPILVTLDGSKTILLYKKNKNKRERDHKI